MKRLVFGVGVVVVFIAGVIAGSVYSQWRHSADVRPAEISIVPTGLPVYVEMLKVGAVLERMDDIRASGHMRYLACGEIQTSQSARIGFETSSYVEPFVQWVVDNDKAKIAIVRYKKQ